MLAQHPGFYQLNDETGLPSNEVYKVIQDEFGYIWIGCDAGLYRYDGFEYKKYVSSKQNSNAVSFLHLDIHQKVWCKNFYGQIFRVEGDSLKLVAEISTSNPAFPPFDTDEKGNLWTCDDSMLIQFSPKGKRLHEFLLNDNKKVTGLKCRKNVLYLIFTDCSVSKFDLDVQIYQSLSDSPGFTGQCREFIAFEKGWKALLENDQKQDKFSVLGIKGNTIIDPSALHLPNENDRIFSIYAENWNLWFTSSYGVFNSDRFNDYLFPDAKVSSMMKDREGQYWFTTLQNGIYIVPEMEVKKYNSSNSGLKEDNIVSVQQNGSGLLFGSYSGKIFYYDTEFDEIKEPCVSGESNYYAVKSSVWNEKYTIISRGPLCIIDHSTCKQYFPKTSNIKDMYLLEDTLYMVQANFIAKASVSEMIKTGNVNYVYLNKTGGKAVEYDDMNKKFYFLLRDGLFIYENGKWKEVKVEGKSVSGNELQIESGIVWVSDATNGIYSWIKEKLVYHFTSKNKLKEGIVRTFHSSNGRLWVCTENYLQSISLKSDSVSNYSTFHSINPKDINKILVLNGKVYLATNKGIVYFPENLEWKSTTAPRIKVLDISSDGQSIEMENEIFLAHDHTNLRFHLSSISLKSRGKYHYEYQLSGLDDNWISIPAQNPFIQFSSIPPGNYELKIKAVNESGVVSTTISYSISVEFPFWQKWWFYVLIGISASLLVALIFIIRIRYIRKRGEIKNKMLLSQLTALKSQMNPHFMFNSLNSIQHLIVKKDIQQSNLYISKFGKLMRLVLDSSGKDKISLQEEIEILELYLELEKLRFGEEFTYLIHFENHINTYQVMISPMILQPFVENAIKHGLLHKQGMKELKILFSGDEELICTITDNGIGRKKSAEIKTRQGDIHQSFATEATGKQIELLSEYHRQNFQFEIFDLEENGIATGTKVVLRMPMG